MTHQLSAAILGADGMLGRAFAQHAGFRDAFDVHALGRTTHDVTSESLDLSPYDLVINCAAYTAVDLAESESMRAHRINADAVANIDRCMKKDAKLVHFSTDYVFDGTARAPVATNAVVSPVNAYGLSKLGGETIAMRRANTLMLRTSWVYAPWGRNFVRTMDRLMATRDVVRVVSDQVGRPTSALCLADTTVALLAQDASGLFHATDGGQTSWHGLAAFIATQRGYDCEVQSCPSAEYPTAAKRPAYSVLDITKTEACLGRTLQPWQQAVSAVLAHPAYEAHA